MEFNAGNQYRPSSNGNIPMTPTHQRHATQVMYPYGSIVTQPPATQPQPLQQPTPSIQPLGRWSHKRAAIIFDQSQQLGGTTSTLQGVETLYPTASSPPTSIPQQQPARYSMPEATLAADYFQANGLDLNSWNQKTCAEAYSPVVDPESTDYSQNLVIQDDDGPIIDLRQYGGLPSESDMSTFSSASTRRMSESSFSMSSVGAVPEGSTYEDLSYASDCEAWNGTFEPSTAHHLSPLASPRRNHDLVRNGSRGSRASPSPHVSHNNVRASPYSMDSGRLKRWSTGVAPTSTPTGSRAIHQAQDRFSSYLPRTKIHPHQSLPPHFFSTIGSFQPAAQNVLFSQPQHLSPGNGSLFPTDPQQYHLEVPRPLPSQGLFRLLQSNADRHIGCSSHFADLSDPPDLYSSLSETPCNPPESDMRPEDPDLVPHEQDLRFAGDLYTPRWVRGHGNKREGWCGLCKPGRWLVLKNSAFWYDKSFTHGVSAATGAAFQGPQETRRTEGNLDVWEGLCGSCGEWVSLVSSKKKGTTWFRHAYKCHTHPKVKDGPKRRRETSHQVRARATSNTSQTSSSTGNLKKEAPRDTRRDAVVSTSVPFGDLSNGFAMTTTADTNGIKSETETNSNGFMSHQTPEANGFSRQVTTPTPVSHGYEELVGFGARGSGLSSLANMI